MKIAICDDDTRMAAEAEGIALECDKMTDIDTEVFLSGPELIKALDNGSSFQIYLLDVMMPDISGLEVAEHIRQRDDSAVIIFITSNKEMMQRAFDVRAFNYLLKDDDRAHMKDVIYRAISYVDDQLSYFSYQKGRERFIIRSGNIMYLESRLRKIRIVTCEGEDDFYGTMDDVVKRLSPVLFARIHKSFIVNLEYVKKLFGNEIQLDNGSTFNVTSNYQDSFNAKYSNFVIRQMAK